MCNTLGEPAALVMDDTGVIQCFDARAESLFGYAAAEVQGQKLSLLLSSCPQALFPECRDELVGARRMAEVRCKDGKRLMMAVTLTHICLAGQKAIVATFLPVEGQFPPPHSLPQPREELLRLIVTNVPVILFALDRDGVFTLSEGHGLEKLGLAPGQLVGQSLFDVYRDAPQVTETARRALAGEAVSVVSEVGDLLFETRYAPFYDDRGQTAGVIGVAVDITDRRTAERAVQHAQEQLERQVELRTAQLTNANRILRREAIERAQAQAALKESEGRFRTIAEATPVTVIITRLIDGRVLYANAHFQTMFGLPADVPATEYNATDCYHDLADREKLLIALAARNLVQDYEIQFKRADGVSFWASGSFQRTLLNGEPAIFCAYYDITSRKQAEEALLRLATIVETSQDAIISKTLDDVIVSWNPGAQRLYGYTAEEAIGNSFSRLVPPADHSNASTLIDRLRAGEHISHIETARRGKNGRVVEISVSISPIRNAGGDIVGVSTIARDITERKRAEEALRESEARFQAFIDAGPVLAVIKDEDGRRLYANERYCEYFGLTSAETLGKGNTDLMPAEVARQVRADDLAVLAADQPMEFLETVPDREGMPRWWQCFKFPFRGAGGKRLLGGVFIDFTERKQAEEALRESEQFARATLNGLSAEIAILDGEGTILAVNEAWRRFAAQNPPLLQNVAERANYLQVCDQTRGPDAEEARQAAIGIRAVAAGERELFTLEYPCHSPVEQRWFNLRVTRFPGDGPACVVISHENITERKQAEQALRQSEERLQLALQAASMGTWEIDLCTGLISAFESYECLLGIAPGTFKGTLEAFFDIVHPEDRDGVMLTLMSARDHKNDFHEECRILWPDGAVHWLALSGRFFYNALGHATRLNGAIMDITIRKQAEQEIQDLNEHLALSNHVLRQAYDATIEGWSRALDLRDKETEGHSQRVTDLALRLAEAMGVADDHLVHVRRGALLHDIGKMGIPDAVLLKPGKLTDEEWVIMRRHPVYALEMLSPIEFLRPALDIPYCHHEKWDGSGYPQGLQGEEIPLAARLFAVVDVWDALRSDRPYRQGWPLAKVREHIRQGAGSHFDPQVVAAFLAMVEPEHRGD